MMNSRGSSPGGFSIRRFLPLLLAGVIPQMAIAAALPPASGPPISGPPTSAPPASAPGALSTAPASLVDPAAAAPAVVATTPAAALAVIDLALAEGRYDDAQSTITRTRATGFSPELLLRIAELTLARNDLAGAALAFAELQGEARVAARGWQGSGITALRQGHLAEAAAALDKALALDAMLARAWNARGVVADRQREWQRAEAAYARAVAADPAMVAALNNRGYSLLLQRRFAEAEADLARAVARDPALVAARTNLRLARAMQGRYEEAFVGSTRDGLVADLNTVGFAAMSRGDDTTAEVYFSRALALNTQYDRTAAANLEFLKQRAMRPDARAGNGER